MTAAATALGYTQSAVSQAVAALEQRGRDAAAASATRAACGRRRRARCSRATPRSLREQLERAAGELDDHRQRPRRPPAPRRVPERRLRARPARDRRVPRARTRTSSSRLDDTEPDEAAARPARRPLRPRDRLRLRLRAGARRRPASCSTTSATTRCSSRSRPATRRRRSDVVPMRAARAARRGSRAPTATCNLLLDPRRARRPASRRRSRSPPTTTARSAGWSSPGVGVALIPELAAPSAGDVVELRRLEPPPARTLHVALPPAPLGGGDRDARRCSGLRAIDPLPAHRRAPAPERLQQRLGPARSTTSISRCSAVTKRSATAWSRKATRLA